MSDQRPTERNRPRLSVTLSTDAASALDELAPRFFGGNQSAVVDWAVRVAAVVLADPAVRVLGVVDPTDALAAFKGTDGPGV